MQILGVEEEEKQEEESEKTEFNEVPEQEEKREEVGRTNHSLQLRVVGAAPQQQ